MLRVAIPYGLLSSAQLRVLAQIARQYDRGYGHFTTRQNIQYNWPRLEDVPEILALLATVEMHAIQTSGNCVRNITSDPFAGVADDEIVDPRPWAELIRQWSTLNPEFAFLPRKFKIAVTGAREDRTAALVHDIGAQAVRNASGEAGFKVDGRRRPGPDADDRPRDSRVPSGRRAAQLFRRHPARLQPVRAARQHLQGADQDPGEGAHAGRVHAAGRSRMGSAARRPRNRSSRGDRAALRTLRRSAVPRIRARQRRLSRGARRQPALVAMGEPQRAPAQAQGLRERDAVAQAHRNAPRGCDRSGNGSDRGARRPLQLRRSARHARAESRARRRAAERHASAVGTRSRRSASRRRTSAC